MREWLISAYADYCVGFMLVCAMLLILVLTTGLVIIDKEFRADLMRSVGKVKEVRADLGKRLLWFVVGFYHQLTRRHEWWEIQFAALIILIPLAGVQSWRVVQAQLHPPVALASHNGLWTTAADFYSKDWKLNGVQVKNGNVIDLETGEKDGSLTLAVASGDGVWIGLANEEANRYSSIWSPNQGVVYAHVADTHLVVRHDRGSQSKYHLVAPLSGVKLWGIPGDDRIVWLGSWLSRDAGQNWEPTFGVLTPLVTGWGRRADSCWAVGKGVIAHWDGSQWTPELNTGHPEQFRKVQECWAISNYEGAGSVWRRTDEGTWNQVAQTKRELLDLAVIDGTAWCVQHDDSKLLCLTYKDGKVVKDEVVTPLGGYQAITGTGLTDIWVGGDAQPDGAPDRKLSMVHRGGMGWALPRQTPPNDVQQLVADNAGCAYALTEATIDGAPASRVWEYVGTGSGQYQMLGFAVLRVVRGSVSRCILQADTPAGTKVVVRYSADAKGWKEQLSQVAGPDLYVQLRLQSSGRGLTPVVRSVELR